MEATKVKSKYYKAYIDRQGGAPIGPMDVPTCLEYVKLERFVNFLVECREFDNENQNPVITMAKAISEFLDYPLIEIVQGQIGDIYAKEHDGIDGSIAQLFAFISKMCFEAKGRLVNPENAQFEVDGVLYEIPVTTQQAIAGEIEQPYLSVVQVVECVEFQRLKDMEVKTKGDPGGFISRSIIEAAKMETDGLADTDPAKMYIIEAAEKYKEKEIDRLGDPNGNQMYNLYLRMAAILSKRAGEVDQMPTEDAEREVWINTRIMAMRNMNVQTALDIDFFLSSILKDCEVIPEIVGFLIRPLIGLAVPMLMKAPPGPKPRRTTKKFSAA